MFFSSTLSSEVEVQLDDQNTKDFTCILILWEIVVTLATQVHVLTGRKYDKLCTLCADLDGMSCFATSFSMAFTGVNHVLRRVGWSRPLLSETSTAHYARALQKMNVVVVGAHETEPGFRCPGALAAAVKKRDDCDIVVCRAAKNVSARTCSGWLEMTCRWEALSIASWDCVQSFALFFFLPPSFLSSRGLFTSVHATLPPGENVPTEDNVTFSGCVTRQQMCLHACAMVHVSIHNEHTRQAPSNVHGVGKHVWAKIWMMTSNTWVLEKWVRHCRSCNQWTWVFYGCDNLAKRTVGNKHNLIFCLWEDCWKSSFPQKRKWRQKTKQTERRTHKHTQCMKKCKEKNQGPIRYFDGCCFVLHDRAFCFVDLWKKTVAFLLCACGCHKANVLRLFLSLWKKDIVACHWEFIPELQSWNVW